MKNSFLLMALSAFFMTSVAFAQPAAPAAKAASTTVTAVCKDGTPYSGATLKGACRGHGGVDKNASAKADAKPEAAKATTASAMTPAAGGAGKVWVNNTTKIYHCSGDRYYGKTKNGAYMTEAEAKAKGFRPDHGKACR